MKTSWNAWFGIGLVIALGAPSPSSAQAKAVVEVPLTVRDGQFLVPVRGSDGTEFTFVLSTGSTTTVLSARAAKALEGQTEVMLGGASVPLLGSVILPDAQLRVGGRSNDGMVGANTLNQFDVLIDAPAGRLLLKPVGPEVSWPGVALSPPVRLRVYHGMVLGLDVAMNGHSFGAILDVGMATLAVNAAAGAKAEIDSEDVAALQVGGRTFADLPVRVIDHPVFAQADPNGAGFVLVGAPLAHRCAVALSWLHAEMRTCRP
jgi:hypothetical protein